MTPLQIVYPDTALRLQALLDFEEEGGEKRVAGDEWLFEGPGTTAEFCAAAWTCLPAQSKQQFKIMKFSEK